MAPPAAVEVRGLHKRYGDVEAVAGIDLTVARGEVFALLGPNGAGQATTVEILEGYRRRERSDALVSIQAPIHRGAVMRAAFMSVEKAFRTCSKGMTLASQNAHTREPGACRRR